LLNLDRRWWRWRVFYVDENGITAFLPAAWTDAGPQDPFVRESCGRAFARAEDLLRLAEVLHEIETRTVKEKMP